MKNLRGAPYKAYHVTVPDEQKTCADCGKPISADHYHRYIHGLPVSCICTDCAEKVQS